MNILENCISPTDIVHNLSVLFDSKFSFTNHVNSAIKSFVICIISNTFSHMMSESWRQMHWSIGVWIIAILCFTVWPPKISQGFRISKIVWPGLSGASLFSHVTPNLNSLHWPPVKQRIIFKTLVFIHKYLTTG